MTGLMSDDDALICEFIVADLRQHLKNHE